MMKIDNLPEIFIKAMPVLQTLEEAGFEAYFVGGSVRDILLQRHVHDVDITTSAYPCLLYTSPSPRDGATSRMPSSA